MKKVISLPSSPAALRKFSSSTSTPVSPTSSPGVAARHATHKAPAKRAGGGHGHGHHGKHFNKTNKSANKKKLALSIKLAVSEDDEDDEGYSSSGATTTTCGSSDSAEDDEDEWERSFDASWVVDEHELALRRRWTDQKGFTTAAGQPTAGAKGGQLRRSPLATNSTLSVSFASLPANERPGAKTAAAATTTTTTLDRATTTSCETSAPVRGSRPPSPSGAAHISYAQLQQSAATSSASCHSPSSSPGNTFTSSTSANSLLPALDLDRVVAPASLGSTPSRRNTIGTTPRDSAVLQPSVNQWKIGKISPRDDDADRDDGGERGDESDEHSGAEISPRRTDLQISFERFEAHLALKQQLQHRQQQQQQQQAGDVEVVSSEQARQPQQEAKKGQKPAKRSASKRKKNVRSLNKVDTDSKSKRRSEEERRTYRRSQGSPPMLLRAIGTGDSDSGAAGYMAEEERASDSSSNSSSSDSGRSRERRFHQVESAHVSPVHSGSSSSLLAAASLALRSGGFPLSRSRSSEVQAKARRTITKENKRREDVVTERQAQSHSADNPAIVAYSPNDERAIGSAQQARGDGQTPGGELTWKTIWQDSQDDEACEGPCVTLTSSSSTSAPPPASASASASSEAGKRVAKRGLDGRSVSLPPAPLPVPSSALPPHIVPLPFPTFATSPPTSLAASFSSPAPATSSVVVSPRTESPAQRHRRRAESSGAPQQLMRVVPPPLSPHTRHLLNHPQLSFERVRKVTLSPSLAARQQQQKHQRQAFGVPLSGKAGSESGEVTTFLRSQSEEINASAFNSDGYDLINFAADDVGAHGRATSWRGRSGGEWRNRSRDASVLALAPGLHPTDLAAQRARVARARSFGLKSDDDDDDDDDLLVDSDGHIWDADALVDDGDFSSDDDDVSIGGVGDDEEEELMIEAELTSFLKRTRSGSHKPLRDFSGQHQSPLMPPKHHHHHLAPPPVASDVHHRHPTAEADEVIDAGLESGESHGHELETM